MVTREADGTSDTDLMPHVMSELFEAFEKKDSAMAMDALRALVLHIQDEDQDQDEEMGE